jgi:glycerate 2-kinase
MRRDVLYVAAAALKAVDPAAALRRLVRVERGELIVGDHTFALDGRRVYLVGAGKASIGMAAVLDQLVGPHLSDAAVVVKCGQAQPLPHIEVLEGSHPVPDVSSLRAGQRLMEIARTCRPHDLLMSLVTGGSSALAVVPAAGISFDDKISTNKILLGSGADIIAMNDVRKHVSSIKGGRLGAAAACQIVNFTVSDVVGDPLDYFADLTVSDRSTFAMAQEACDRYSLWEQLPDAVVRHLRRAHPSQETCRHLPGATSFVVATAKMMCDAGVSAATALGYRSQVLRLDLEGQSAEAGRWFADQLCGARPGTALLAGGEATTVLDGRKLSQANGGPSQEGAVAAALQTRQRLAHPVVCAFLDSDGTDGPTDAAGGLVDDMTVDSFQAAGIEAHRVLAEHSAYSALLAVGDLVFTGPTGTNVNDLKIGLAGGD